MREGVCRHIWQAVFGGYSSQSPASGVIAIGNLPCNTRNASGGFPPVAVALGSDFILLGA